MDLTNYEVPDGEPKDDLDNLWMTMANPYMKAVKHNDASKEAEKDKKPIWIGPQKFSYDNVPKTYVDSHNKERKNRNLAILTC